MTQPMIPQNYAQWHHCITVECGLELTPDFIDERLAALNNQKDQHTQHFVRLYGEQYLQAVIAWFQQAQNQQ